MASVKYKNGTMNDLINNVKIRLKDGVNVVRIKSYDDEFQFTDTTQTRKISVNGEYSDNVEHQITDPVFGTKYLSENPSVVSVDTVGNLTSNSIGKTNILVSNNGQTLKIGGSVDIFIKPPENLKAVPSTSAINLSWDLSPSDPKWVTAYKVFRSDVEFGMSKELGALQNGITVYTDITAIPGYTYFYSVQAISSIANEFSIKTERIAAKLLN